MNFSLSIDAQIVKQNEAIIRNEPIIILLISFILYETETHIRVEI